MATSVRADAKLRRRSRRTGRRLLWLGAVVVLSGGSGYWFLDGANSADDSGTTFAVRRGPLEITVLEGGSIEAKESQQIKSEVQGQVKILSIVEEGYMLTPEDVENGLVLVELDSKELLDRQLEQELQYQNAKASFTEAREQYDIQVNQNASDIKAAELEAKFARMDLQKYLGIAAASDIIRQLGLDRKLEAMRQVVREMPKRDARALAAEEDEEGAEQEEQVDGAEPSTGGEAKTAAIHSSHARDQEIDFSSYADPTLLGDGEAQQKLRQFDDDLGLAREEVGLAQTKLEGTQRLFEKEFVTKNDLENDQIALKRKEINLAAAEASMDLFIKYEFPKQAEKLLSDYEEALRKLERASKLAISKLAQAEAKLNSAEASLTLQTRNRKELGEQIEKCTIRAERPGLVVYGGDDEQYWRQERIEEGATVRERQAIITIPDTTVMVVKVKVHESFVQKVEKGQRARIRVDANADVSLEGTVEKIAVLPDSQNRWMNPDLKVYATDIIIDGAHEWLKPGMSAEAEIIVDMLPDVLQAPIQAISLSNGEQVCYVLDGGEPERRVVETGALNESFIEIKNGLKEGEVVLLRVPDAMDEEEKPPAEEGGKKKAPKERKKKDGATEAAV